MLMYRSLRRVGAAGAAGVLTLAITASASAAMTVSLGEPNLSSRVAISVPVTVSCGPFDPALTHFSSGASVSVEQAAGSRIARGNGMTFSSLPDLLFACDSAAHTFAVNVLADTNGPPFHGGPAVLVATAAAGAGIPCSPDSTTCFFGGTSQTAATGPTTLNLH